MRVGIGICPPGPVLVGRISQRIGSGSRQCRIQRIEGKGDSITILPSQQIGDGPISAPSLPRLDAGERIGCMRAEERLDGSRRETILTADAVRHQIAIAYECVDLSDGDLEQASNILGCE